jgi:hypothetical protein
MFVCLLIYFVCIPFLYLFIFYVMWLLYHFFFFESISCSKTSCRNYNYIIAKKKSRNIIDLYENKKCELNYFNYNFTRLYIRYYEKFSRIQRIKSISKQTEYDNLVLEQDILSKKCFSSFDIVCLFLVSLFCCCCLFVLILIENYRKI